MTEYSTAMSISSASDGLVGRPMMANTTTTVSMSCHSGAGTGAHCTTETMSSIKRSTPIPTFIETPTNLTREDSAAEATSTHRAGTIGEWGVPCQGNMVEPEIPDTGIYHTIGAESHDCANDGTCKTVIPVMELVDRQCTADQHSTQDRRIDRNQLPERWVVVCEDLELGVEIQIEEDEASERSGGVARRERFQ